MFHANKNRELVGIVYSDMSGKAHVQIALDQVVNTLNHPRLQEDLLVIRGSDRRK